MLTGSFYRNLKAGLILTKMGRFSLTLSRWGWGGGYPPHTSSSLLYKTKTLKQNI